MRRTPTFLQLVKKKLGKRWNKLPQEQKQVIRDINRIKKSGGPVGSRPVPDEGE